MSAYIVSGLEWAAQHGIWDFTSTIILLVTSVTGFVIFFSAKRRVKNLNFFFRPLRNKQPSYPLVVLIEIRNYTGRTVVISSPCFNYDSIRPDANARGDSASGDYEIKFPRHLGAGALDQVEFMLRHGETVSTWVPLDPTHSDVEVAAAMQGQRVGKIKCVCTWLMDKPSALSQFRFRIGWFQPRKVVPSCRRSTSFASRMRNGRHSS